MNSEWKSTEWGELATLEYGKGLRGYESLDKPYRVYGTNGPIGTHDAALTDEATVVVGRKGAYRGIHYSSAPCYVIDTAFYLKPLVGLDMRWAYYALLTQDINGMDSGSAIPSTSREAFYRLHVRLPPFWEQRTIASILGALDDKIAVNRKMSATLEAIARALFKSWFVDFDPVRAKAENRDTGLAPDVAAMFPNVFDNSAIGGIPKGWQLGTISEIAALNPEVWLNATRPDTIAYIDLSNVKWGRFEVPRRYARSEAPSRAQRVLRPGDTLVGTVRPANGSYGLVADHGMTGSTGFAVLRPTTFRSITYLAATSKTNIEWLGHLADGAAYPAVRPEIVANTNITLAPNEILRAFEVAASPVLERYAQADHESRLLAALRDSLLPKLISGELTVANPESVLEKSA